MTILGSLTNRIFLASAALAVVSIGAAVYFVSRTTTREVEAGLQRGLIEAGALVDQQGATLSQNLSVMAKLVADLPKLKAAVDTGDPPTVEPIALDYQKQLGAELLVITDRQGTVLGRSGELDLAPAAIAGLPEIKNALAGRESGGFWPQPNGVLQIVTIPVAIGLDRPEIMGTLTVGFWRLDNQLAEQFKRATESDIAFAFGGEIKASTLAAADLAGLTSILNAESTQRVSLASGDYLAMKRPLGSVTGTFDGRNTATVLLLKSRSEQLRFLDAINTGLGVMAVIAVLAATILSYAVARTITRPLATITNTMREISTTGDLTRKISLRHAGSWDDEDATLLATTFNSLTDSIGRFQREATQRERLSALGRLSTVIAHEVRNPLMIIKTSLRMLARDNVSREEVKQVLKDVDEEVARLNRIVNDVLDFARPIRFEYAAADLNAVCADAEQATRAGSGPMLVKMLPDASLDPIVIDAERLRTALVNILANARHAVAAREPAEAGSEASRSRTAVAADADIELETIGGKDDHVTIVIRDRGIGIRPQDLPRVFDPYFTTKRTGSGLGLAIAKNIIEGMGGSITLESRTGSGTEIRIDLPSHPREAGDNA